MKKRYLLGIIFLFLLLSLLLLTNKSYAGDLDRIVNYVVTVDPRMNDGTLDITYEITWKVLDSMTEGPLEWAKIGTPNSNFDTPTALTKNIKKISKYSGSNVRIDFDKAYYAGDQITFKYSIHQSYMYKISGGTCKYEFTPAWFTDAKVDNLTIKWNADKVIKSDSKSTEGNYLVWNKKNMSKGSKLTTSIQYDKASFSALNASKQATGNGGASYSMMNMLSTIIPIAVIIIIIACCLGIGGGIGRGGGGYYGHRGFYGGGFYGGGCAHSSCACACAHSSCASSCACACAGSGRAGCSKKDFYGTNLTSKKIKKVFEKEAGNGK